MPELTVLSMVDLQTLVLAATASFVVGWSARQQ